MLPSNLVGSKKGQEEQSLLHPKQASDSFPGDLLNNLYRRLPAHTMAISNMTIVIIHWIICILFSGKLTVIRFTVQGSNLDSTPGINHNKGTKTNGIKKNGRQIDVSIPLPAVSYQATAATGCGGSPQEVSLRRRRSASRGCGRWGLRKNAPCQGRCPSCPGCLIYHGRCPRW